MSKLSLSFNSKLHNINSLSIHTHKGATLVVSEKEEILDLLPEENVEEAVCYYDRYIDFGLICKLIEDSKDKKLNKQSPSGSDFYVSKPEPKPKTVEIEVEIKKEEPKEEVKEEPKEEVKEEPKEEVKEEIKEEIKEEQKVEVAPKRRRRRTTSAE